MEWIDIAERLLDWAIPFACAAVVGWAAAQVKSARESAKKEREETRAHDENFRKGMLALLRNAMIFEYNHRMREGSFPIYARENMTAMYNVYIAEGGNGTIPMLYEEMQHLPIRKDEHEVDDEQQM